MAGTGTDLHNSKSILGRKTVKTKTPRQELSWHAQGREMRLEGWVESEI